ncbi:MAG: hypothetical protein KGI35_16685, partial [Burkholderiales bacterium]|nr:hypothetical protein [Burkholderiales bacterium]
MGMSISGVGNAWSAQAAGGVGASRLQQRQQNFQALFSAIKAGNLGAAQQAYTGLTGSKSLAAATSAARSASADGASAL